MVIIVCKFVGHTIREVGRGLGSASEGGEVDTGMNKCGGIGTGVGR